MIKFIFSLFHRGNESWLLRNLRVSERWLNHVAR